MFLFSFQLSYEHFLCVCRCSAPICQLLFFAILQIVALREQNAHIQRKVASGEGGEDMLEGSEAQQKVHGKVSLLNHHKI